MEHLTGILELLGRERDGHVLAGWRAVVFHGVPLVARDAEARMPFIEENLLRLERALTGPHPVHRQTPQRMPLRVAGDFPRGLESVHLRADPGVLDCLGEILRFGNYGAVQSRSETVNLRGRPAQSPEIVAAD